MSGDAPALGAVAAGLGPVLEAGGERLAGLLERTEARLAEAAADPGGQLARRAHSTLAAGGKRLRPMLVFLCAGDADGGDLVRAAVAVELLHMATLVHDDVLDRATLRRGRPTVFASEGRAAALATGNVLFARAFAELTAAGGAEGVAALSRASSALARGELMQREDAWAAAVDERRYLERCELKTARLFEAACRLGAIFGSSGARAAGPLGRFGLRIGLAFQILDDVLDVSGPAARTGKHRGTDLLDGTVTLPLILARRADARVRAADLRALRGPADAERLCDLIAATGALDEARSRALAHVEAARGELGGIELDERSAAALQLVARGVVERYA